MNLKESLNKAFKFTEKHLNAKADILSTVFKYNKNLPNMYFLNVK